MVRRFPRCRLRCDEGGLRCIERNNLTHHRLSIEWARIEPAEGRRDLAAVEHYRAILEAARDAGVSPWVCLHHFTLPGWFTEIGEGAFRDDQPSLPVAGCPGPLGIVFNFYTAPQAGQKRRYGVAGSSYVGVVELADQPKAWTILQFGQSGDPTSPHWFDQAPIYAKGEFKVSFHAKADVEAQCKRPYHPGDMGSNGTGK